MEKENISKKLEDFEINLLNDENEIGERKEKKKRLRKKKNQILRSFVCHVEGCDKSYGSENSLNQHIKNKHENEWNNKKQRKLNINCKENLEEKKDHFLEKSNDDIKNEPKLIIETNDKNENKDNEINFSDIKQI